MKELRKVVLIGGFGHKDIGDEAMPQAVLFNLRKSINNLDIVMLSPNPNYTTSYHGERSIKDINSYLNRKPLVYSLLTSRKRLGIIAKFFSNILTTDALKVLYFEYFLCAVKAYSRFGTFVLPITKDAKEITKEIASADLLFNNGGGNINSLLYGELIKQCLTINIASILNVPVIVSGQTMGPYEKSIHKKITRKAINKVRLITFRDKNISKNRLLEIGVSKPEMLDTADDAVTLPTLSPEKVEELIIENDGQKWHNIEADLVVALNLNGYLLAMNKKSHEDYEHEVSLLSDVANRLIEEFNAKVFLVPTDYIDVSDDRPLLRKIHNRIHKKNRSIVIETEYDAIQYKGLVSSADIAIGSRYHFIVFATSSGVPCIGTANGIYQKTKLKGVHDLYSIPKFFISEDMVDLSFDKLWEKVTQLINNRKELSSNIKKMSAKIENDSLVSIRLAVSILNSTK
jgi:polysaccharide pyruvyl transferase WcaK-like protein